MIDNSNWFNQKYFSLKRIESLFLHDKRWYQYNIDLVAFDTEEHFLIIRGWGFSRRSNQSLEFSFPGYNETAVLKRRARLDVNDIYKLDSSNRVGFEIRINDFGGEEEIRFFISAGEEKPMPIMIKRSCYKVIPMREKVRRYYKKMRFEGVQEAYNYFVFHVQNHEWDDYAYWIEKNENCDLKKIKDEMNGFSLKPTVSIVVPVYNAEEKWLKECVDSVKKQVYDNWELCLADDCSTKSGIRPLLLKMQQEDKRIKVVFRDKNGRIAKATNSAINISTGDYIGFMDNDDELSPFALYYIVKSINEDTENDFFYSDEDKIDISGCRFDPFFKPNWNETLLLHHNYITHFVVVSRQLLDTTGYLSFEMDGSQDYDFVLRATEKANRICHIPKILYHWRTVETSVAADPTIKQYAYSAGKRAIEASYSRRGLKAKVSMTENYGLYKSDFQIQNNPMVSILIFNNDENSENCIASILEQTCYSQYEILIEKNDTLPHCFEEKETCTFYYGSPFVEGAKQARGEFLVFLNSHNRITSGDWIKELLNYMTLSSTGIVGGKVITKDNYIENAGIWIDQSAQQIHYVLHGENNRELGYYFRAVMPQELFAVTEDFCIIRKRDYHAIGGIDNNLAPHWKGIDLCLRLKKKGLNIIWTPYAVCECENLTRLTKFETQQEHEAYNKIEEKWPKEELQDQYLNPELQKIARGIL